MNPQIYDVVTAALLVLVIGMMLGAQFRAGTDRAFACEVLKRIEACPQ